MLILIAKPADFFTRENPVKILGNVAIFLHGAKLFFLAHRQLSRDCAKWEEETKKCLQRCPNRMFPLPRNPSASSHNSASGMMYAALY
jgi:hypothetical protein